jgi:BirA family biotin operon repressor/biotin-[acetyl-CoA-carboxylase] ligase
VTRSVKQAALLFLEQNRHKDVSGEELAQRLGVSRSAVWKAVRALRKDGYEIFAATNRGYRLAPGSDTLSEQGIRLRLPPGCASLSAAILVEKSMDSTNRAAKLLALEGAAHGTLVLAEGQTGGRGRFLRPFFSPAGTGLYMSLVLRPEARGADATLITIAAAIAVCRTIKALTSFAPQIKWVNDIYLDGKKICGILTEATSDFESGGVTSVVVGIGLNYNTREDEFPPELRDRAGSLFPDGKAAISRNAFAAALVCELLRLCESGALAARDFLCEYRALSCVIGRMVEYTKDGACRRARAVGIDDDGRLLVEDAQGGVSALFSGEVSLTL